MKLRTSYFNAAVLRKDITRFAPVWALYTVFLLLCVMLLDFSVSASLALDICQLMSGMVWVNLLYAGISAALLFGDLFNPRMCNALHAMPMRRSGWFLTHTAAGLLFCLVPNTVAALICCLLLGEYFYIALIWLAVAVLQYLFFFGVGAFSALCAGNRLAMAALYGILNFLALLVYYLADQFYEPLLYGIRLELDMLEFLSPALHITGKDYVLFTYDKIRGGIWGGFVPDPWYYLFILAGIGVVLLALAMLVYRLRKLESAGDFISLRPIGPVFLIIYTLAAGLLVYAFGELFGFGNSYVFLVIGILVGFFTGKMLLDRTIKVFRPKVFLGLFLLIVSLAGSMALTWLDPFGITWFIPETEDIQWMQVYNKYDHFDSLSYAGPPAPTYTDPEQIEQFRDLHRQLLSDREANRGYTCDVYVVYGLTDGSTVTRYYTVSQYDAAWQELEACFSHSRYVFQTDDWDSFVNSVAEIEVDLNGKYEQYENSYFTLTEPAQIRQLLEAVKLDCDAGNMAQDWSFHQDEDAECWLYIATITDDGVFNYRQMDLTVYSSCTNTKAFLDAYTPPEKSDETPQEDPVK